jgi:two-component system sensor histidine kinase UhpB
MLDRLELERRESNRRAHLAREAERRRIGRELHDEIGQRLTGILLQLERTRAHVPPELRENVLRTQELARSTLDEVGAIAWRLRPGILDDLGLVMALEALVQSVSDPAHARIRLRVIQPLPALGTDTEIVLYRVAQEGLTNALRHAHATEIRVVLRQHGGGVRLEVVDDGCGFDKAVAEGEGLRGMRERALSIGGHLQIGSRPRGGVTISLDVAQPLDGD